MTGRTKRLVATIVLILFLLFYFLAVMMLAAAILPGVGTTLELLYWAVTGTIWAIPAGALIKWMYR